ncbi:DUF7541 family protein [Halorarius halobius]|uniref:DUF7541 family protein n=1 Tax=Halorarius halobius TaxID=2962671 RepID=UPI0020CE6FD9|nr:cox cluster protein [Halorarius halobius]
MTADADASAVSDARKASPWPLFVALGLAVGEVGVVMALYPVAVAGLLLFVGSVAGIVSEAGYAERPWRLLAGLGAVLVVFGLWVVSTQLSAGTAWLAAASTADSIVLRGFSIAAAGVIAVAAGGAGGAVATDPGANQ